MEFVYAAPFAISSLLGLAICLIVPRLRKHAALVFMLPLVCAAFSFAGYVSFALLMVYTFRFSMLAMNHLTGLELACCLMPGAFGFWLTLQVKSLADRSILRSRSAQDIELRLAVAGAAALIGGYLGLAIANCRFPLNLAATLSWGATAAMLSGVLGFLLTAYIQHTGEDAVGPNASA